MRSPEAAFRIPALLPAEAPTARTGVSWHFLPSVACLCAALLMIIAGDDWVNDLPGELVVWVTAGVLLSMTIYGWYISRSRHHNPWIVPMYLVTALYCFEYGWGSLVAYYWHQI